MCAIQLCILAVALELQNMEVHGPDSLSAMVFPGGQLCIAQMGIFEDIELQ